MIQLGPEWQKRLVDIMENDELAAQPPATLSLFMIVKNEEKTLARVLNAAKQFCDEMIVVDTGSTDRTVEIAKECGAETFFFQWRDDFAAARNYAMGKCKSQWTVWLDADDVIPDESIKAIQKLKRTLLLNKEYNTVFAPYHYEYNEQGNVAVNLNRERFLRNYVGHKWVGRIHETLAAPWEKSVRVEEVIIEHRTADELKDRKKGRNLRIFEQYLDIEKDSLRELFLYGSELQAVERHEDAIKVYQTYLRRVGNQIDGVGERYSVLMKMADTYYGMKKIPEAIGMCTDCIRLDPNRAEGYTILGAILYFSGFHLQAMPLFAAAMLCTIPPPNVSLVVQKLYFDLPAQLIVEGAVKMKSLHTIERFLQIASSLEKVIPQVQDAILKAEEPVVAP